MNRSFLTLGDRRSCHLWSIGFRPIWPTKTSRRTMKLEVFIEWNLGYTVPQKFLKSHTGGWFFAGKSLKINYSVPDEQIHPSNEFSSISTGFIVENLCLDSLTTYLEGFLTVFDPRTLVKATNVIQNFSFHLHILTFNPFHSGQPITKVVDSLRRGLTNDLSI